MLRGSTATAAAAGALRRLVLRAQRQRQQQHQQQTASHVLLRAVAAQQQRLPLQLHASLLGALQPQPLAQAQQLRGTASSARGAKPEEPLLLAPAPAGRSRQQPQEQQLSAGSHPPPHPAAASSWQQHSSRSGVLQLAQTPFPAAGSGSGLLQSDGRSVQPHAPQHGRHVASYASYAQHSEYKMESLLMFDSCWRRFEDRYGMDFRVPREVVWLNGAPGSGKGVNTEHILKTRGLTKHFTISGLLESFPEARRLIESGEMIPDTLVGDLLLEALLLDEPGLQDDLGFVVDGFPRTACQVDFLKMLYDKMCALHSAFADSARSIAFPRPSFKVVILYVDEETSIKRQLQRARVANLHNRRVLDAGAGHFFEERATDTDIDKCRKRYAIFKTHYAATLRLKNYFPFTLIDAMGSIEETRQQITKELRYQSSLDLSIKTYERLRHLPLAKDVVLSARQELVMRLDGYAEANLDLFEEVIDRIINDVLPVIRQSGLAGHAEYVTRSPFFSDNPAAVDMLVDVLTDRGFHVCYIREDTAVPQRVDLASGSVTTLLKPCHKFRISFDARGPRDDIKALEIAARMAESNATLQRDIRISHSVIPDHFGGDDDGGGGGAGGGDFGGAEDEDDEEARAAALERSRRVAGFTGS